MNSTEIQNAHGTNLEFSVSREGHLQIGQCDVEELVETYGSPLFVYDEELIRSSLRSYHKAFQKLNQPYHISYASKAFCTIAMCQLMAEEGAGIDVVSGGELYTALRAGVPAAVIHFHGNNKTREEVEFAVSSEVGTIIVDNFHELSMVNEIALGQNRLVRVLLRIAPGVEAHTHEFISTGQQDSKFGFDLQSGQGRLALAAVRECSQLVCAGLHMHIGSQIFDSQGHLTAIERLCQLYQDGLNLGLPLTIFNVGGGFGIRYTEEDTPVDVPSQIFDIVKAVRVGSERFDFPTPEIWIEPGRTLAGPAGITLYRTGSQKQIEGVRNYLSVDGGMTDNPRLALYGARYEAVLACRLNEPADSIWSIAGKCCESGDMLVWNVALPTPVPGDILAVFATGAYNYSMASNYNRIPRPAVVFVRNGQAKIVVKRETWEDMVRQDCELA